MTRRVTVPAPPSVVSSLTASNVTAAAQSAAAPANAAAESHVSTRSSSSSAAAAKQKAREALVDRLGHLESEIAKERLAHEATQRSFQRTAKEVELLRDIVAARFDGSANPSSSGEVAANRASPRRDATPTKSAIRSSIKKIDRSDAASVASTTTIMSTSTLYAHH